VHGPLSNERMEQVEHALLQVLGRGLGWSAQRIG
jgi:hypothetical protein